MTWENMERYQLLDTDIFKNAFLSLKKEKKKSFKNGFNFMAHKLRLCSKTKRLKCL